MDGCVFFSEGRTNILSLSRVKEKFRITFDSATDNCFHIHKKRKLLKFREAVGRLYYFDTAECDEELTMLITTVEDDKNRFLAYDYTKAKLDRSLQKRVG